MNSPFTLVHALICFCLLAGAHVQAVAELPSPLALGDHWTLISSANLSDSGERISAPDYPVKGNWMKAVVPGTVLTSYVKAGRYPDPYYGLNNKLYFDKKGAIAHSRIPDASVAGSVFAVPHWYRTTFSPPADYAGKTVWLKFSGINWRATFFLNGNNLGTITGAYKRGIFNVTEFLKPGLNTLAVQIDPLPEPGTSNGSRCGGDRKIGLSPAAIYQTVGWDFSFMDGVRDRNIGILRDVALYATGAVDVRDPLMSTEGVPTKEQANLNFRTALVNSSGKEQKGKLVVQFADHQISQDVTLAPNETRDVRLSHKEFPALSLDHPKLWWPAGRGEAFLYPMKVSFRDANGQATEVQRSFGVRSIENRPELGQWVCWVNGKRMFLSGGNWVQDAMQRQTPARQEAQIRMIRQAGLNWLRLWSASGPQDDAFFDCCDKYGILAWAEANLAVQVHIPRTDPEFCKITLENWADYILRIRHHACVFNYVGCNEGAGRSPIDVAGMEEMVRRHDGTRSYSESSQDMGRWGVPYRWLDSVNGYYTYSNLDINGTDRIGLFWGFNNESGAPSLPAAEVIKEMIPKDKRFPVDREYVAYLDGGGFHRMYEYITKGCARFGNLDEPDLAGRTGVDNYAFKGQMLNAMVYRAMGELWQRNKWDKQGRFATGFALWTVNNTHPQICSRLYDYSLEANSSLYYMAHANKALHVQFDYNSSDLSAVNNSFLPAANLKVRAEVRNLDWSLQWSAERDLPSLPAEKVEAGLIWIPPRYQSKSFSDVHFVRCQLLHQKGDLLDDTIYWRTKRDDGPGADGDFRALGKMPTTRLKVASNSRRSDGKRFITARLENSTKQLAFFIRLKPIDPVNRSLVRPCYYSDNYFSVLPGETKEVTIECPPSAPGEAEPRLVVEGWNIETVELGT